MLMVAGAVAVLGKRGGAPSPPVERHTLTNPAVEFGPGEVLRKIVWCSTAPLACTLFEETRSQASCRASRWNGSQRMRLFLLLESNSRRKA